MYTTSRWFVQGGEDEELLFWNLLNRCCKSITYFWVFQISLEYQVTLRGATFSADLWVYRPCFFFNDAFSDGSFLGFAKLCLSSTSCLWSHLLLFQVRHSPVLGGRRIMFRKNCRHHLWVSLGLVTSLKLFWAISVIFLNLLPTFIRRQSGSPSLRAKFARLETVSFDSIARTYTTAHQAAGGSFGLRMIDS